MADSMDQSHLNQINTNQHSALNQQTVCPSCGYCPTCGRKNEYTQYPFYYNPYQQPYYTTCQTTQANTPNQQSSCYKHNGD